ncbi:MAG: YkgJ family cysteine cluster protein [Polyangiaceae bacterium]
MSGGDSETAPGPLRELWTEIGAAFERTFARHPDALACRSGCADCCVAGLAVDPVEAHALEVWLDAASEDQRRKIAALASRPEETSCVLLDEDAACSIYPARPIICRVFGLAMRLTPELAIAPGERRRLPIYGVPRDDARVISTCSKNFVSEDPERAAPDVIVDDASSQLRRAAVSRSFSRSLSPGAPTERASLVAIVRARLGVPPPPQG